MHMPYEATVSFTPDTYIRVVTEICESAAKHGAKMLMIVNWHEGNIPSLAIAAEDLHRRVGMTVLTVQACYVAEEMFGEQCNGLTHGGEIEALAVLACRPELVHLDRIGNSSDHHARPPHGQAPPHAQLPAGADRHPQHRADRLVRRPRRRDRRARRRRWWRRSPSAIADRGELSCSSSSTASSAARPRSSICARSTDGKVIALGDAGAMNLPGRRAREIVGAIAGAASSTVRLVEIDPDGPGAKPRGPHVHHGFEECIHVLAGEGVTRTENGEYRVSAGDTVLVPVRRAARHLQHRFQRSAAPLLLPGQRHPAGDGGVRVLGREAAERDDARRALPSPGSRLHPRRRGAAAGVERSPTWRRPTRRCRPR